MKHVRKVMMLAFVLLLALTVSGCTGEELRILSALQKRSEAKSYEQSSRVSFALDFSGDDESLQKLKYILDGFVVEMQTQYEGDLQANQFKSYINANMSLDPVTLGFDMWMDMDLNDTDPRYQVVMRIPAMVKAMLPAEYGKDYLDIDYIQLFDLVADKQGPNFSKTLLASIDTQKKLVDFFGVMAQTPGLSGNFVKSTTVAGGLTKLTLTMSDAQMKGFIMALLDSAKAGGPALDLLTELYGPFLALADLPADGDSRQLIAAAINAAYPAAEKYFAHNPILGDKGLVYEVLLDKNDTILSDSLAVSISISPNAVSVLPYSYLYGGYDYDDDEMDEMNGTGETPESIAFTMTLANTYTQVNSGRSVVFPVLNEENSADLVAVMRKQLEEQREAEKFYTPWFRYDALSEIGETPVEIPLAGTFNGEGVRTSVQISRRDYSYYMPLRQAAEIFGGDIGWNAESKTASWSVDGENLLVVTSEDAMAGDSYAPFGIEDDFYTIEGYVYKGSVFIDIADIEWRLDANFGFDEEAGVILLQ